MMVSFPQTQDVMAAVRARGWTDVLWEDVGRLRSGADAVRIFKAYDGESEQQALRFAGDVLQLLMDLVPYPVPANRPQVRSLKLLHPP